MKIYLQLWSVADATKQDFFGTLEKVAQMGYAGVEFAGFGGIPAKEMKKKLDELGLEGISAHVGCDLLRDDLDGVISDLKTIGAKFLICPSAELRTLEDAKKLASFFTEIGKKCAENGIVFGYHNHDFELAAQDGEYPLDALYGYADPAFVKQQPDVFWLEYAGVDAIEYLTQHKTRCPMIHLKQIRGKDNVDAQDGTIDFAKIVEMCPEAVFVYEQEEYPNGTSMECVARSAEYLVTL
ncbi:Xylose isomerase-like TIM barrel [uncultured Ruminococcus sp.]|uniref:sugar phosphate isomerase/epimerase family protein n=1 Tax=Massiliimalia timonensis TaxID=1987501 RepID=UPI000822F128|nr:sugar phosphate isomerase/epimerase [Massiliimalia timonensis]SCI08278.1 Xylose isomerase-like TIM barrel [uncultured Clostridium sp.]SCI36089.1 Xylose isomerase-like TIM barrel [uncultured Ruminococcus sp.]